MAMALASLVLLLCLSPFSLSQSQSEQLRPDYYQTTCPRFEEIMRDTVTTKQIASPTTAAAILRLFFHDCFAGGCDASVLISSTPFHKAERDADINLSLPGDAFDLVVRAKTALELACPSVVSCSDILAVASRDLLTMMGGPFYPVQLGRKDALVSDPALAESTLPKPTMPMTELIEIFASKGFSVEEMVALNGAHTIGFSHCDQFSADLSRTDPTYNPTYADGLRRACADSRQNPSLSVFNDIMTPNKFDNMYFRNLPKGLGLLSSDRVLYSDRRTRPFVEAYAANETAFFEAFRGAMEKLSILGVKAGQQGEIRRRCDAFN
ncbi:peroxidase 63 [Diospyros lotus]|uniref:peroxidase 63 n=1 Tax=Diospyros lotus TaxID=55363 RepID=UPI00224D57C9|nr:peroxidase 63 [Diospyros lotus]